MVSGPQEGTGPTWNDVQSTVEALETQSGAQVVLRVRFYKAGPKGHRSASVVAAACRGAGASATEIAYGYYGFRGAGGASTMPAAMYMALLMLQDKLDARRDKAQQQSAF